MSYTYKYTIEIITEESEYVDNTYIQLTEQLDEIGGNLFDEEDNEIFVASVKVEPVT